LRVSKGLSNPEHFRNEYDCTGAYVYLMLLYYQATTQKVYLEEARKAGDRLLQIGFEYPYEFTTTALGPLAMFRLFKATGVRAYLDGVYIPLAAILRHSWLFNPSYGDYRGRRIFLLTEGMPSVYANGWEEAALVRNLALLWREAGGTLPAPVTRMVAELLRWKGISDADGLAPLEPDPSVIYNGIPREWTLPIQRSSFIPMEGFGYLEWDHSGLHNKPGRVSQSPYCFGMLPENALALFHPLGVDGVLYCAVPVLVRQTTPGSYRFTADGFEGAYECRVRQNNDGPKIRITARGKAVAAVVHDGWMVFRARTGLPYTIVCGMN
jgi:hypothetical protein